MSLGYLSVVFLITMYLQGIRALSPLDAALLLTPGYVVGSLLSPYMGRLSDRYGARVLATSGTAMLILATLVYVTFRVDTPLWEVLVASGISGLGTAMFFPSNNSAVMANAPQGSYGGISGILRTVQNIGVLGSFVIAITVSAAVQYPGMWRSRSSSAPPTSWAGSRMHSSAGSMPPSSRRSSSSGSPGRCHGCGATRYGGRHRGGFR